MTQGDDRILELLEDSGLILSPAVIAKNTDYTRNYINKRVRKLEPRGLVESTDGGYYQITELGRRYLYGEVDADELE